MKRKHGENGEASRLSKLLFNKTQNLVDKFSTAELDDLKEIHRKPAWEDLDDKNFGANVIPNVNSDALYTDKLKQKYETLMGTPSWAQLNKNAKQIDDDDEVLRKVGHLHNKSSQNLKKDFLELKKLPIINSTTGKEGPIITSVEFHPKMSIAMVGGESGIVSLFSIGGETNNKLHSFKLPWRVFSAHFTPNGSEAYIASNMSHTYCVYDLVKAEPQLIQLPHIIKRPTIFQLSSDGQFIATSDGFDEIYILSAASRELLKVLKHNTNVASVVFSHDCSQLYCYGVEGEMTVWSMATYRAINKFYDHGCVTASCLTTSTCGKLIATGSGEGIVNIYQTSSLTTKEPIPQKIISNLTTKITHLKFNPSTEILSMSSALYPNAFKLVHIPSYHVFMNFPKPGMNLYQVETVNFSPNSGYMAYSNNKGKAFLYRLKYYPNY